MPTATPSELVHIGEIGKLKLGDAKIVPVAATEKAYDALWKSMAANDTEGEAMMAANGELMIVAPGTKVRVIDSKVGFMFTNMRKQVRILSGPFSGRSGWVASSWVVQAESGPKPTEQQPEEQPYDEAATEAQYLREMTDILSKDKQIKAPAKQAQLVIDHGKKLEKEGEVADIQYWRAAKIWLEMGASPKRAAELMPVFADTLHGVLDSSDPDDAGLANDPEFTDYDLPRLIGNAIIGKRSAMKKLRLGDLTKIKSNDQRCDQVIKILGKRYKGANRKAKEEDEAPKP
jgi:hypothetical protein